MSRHVRRLAAALLAAALCVAMLSHAHAHAVLVSSVPADRQVLTQAPGRVDLRFNEPVEVMSLRLLDPSGRSVTLQPAPDGVPERAAAALPALGRGTHVLSWRLVSADGHPVAGSLLFSVEAVSSGGQVVAVGMSPVLSAAHGAVRVLAYAATLFAAGTAVFLLLFGGNRAIDPVAVRRPAIAAAGVGAMATFVVVVLEAAMLAGDADALPAALSRLATQSVAHSAVLRAAALALIAAGLVWPRTLRLLGTGGVLAVAASYPLTGHTAPLNTIWLFGLLAVHLFAAAFWIGAFRPLLLATRHPDAAEAARLMVAFSRVAIILVPLLVLAGVVMAWRLAGGWPALLSDPYGQAVLVKAVLVAVMLGLAAWNKARLVPALRRNGDGRRLRRSIRGETVLAALVLVVTAGLTSVPPAGHAAADGHAHHRPVPSPVTAQAMAGPLALQLTVSPGRAGDNAFDLAVTAGDGAARDVVAAALRIGNPGLGIEDILRPLRRVGLGRYRLEGPELAAPGRWRITAELLVSDFEKRTVVMDIEVERPEP